MARELNKGSRKSSMNGLVAIARRFAILAVLCLFDRAAGSQAQSAASVPDVLPKARSFVAQFVEEFATIRYEEDLSQQKLKDNGKIAYKQEMVFDSIIRMRFDDEGKLRVDEQRIMEKTPVHVEKRPLLNTYGFSTLAMIFHPVLRIELSLHALGATTPSMARCWRAFDFEHIPGTPTPAALSDVRRRSSRWNLPVRLGSIRRPARSTASKPTFGFDPEETWG